VLKIECSNCQHELTSGDTSYRCPLCGGSLDYAEPFKYDASTIDESKPGIWRYSASFGLPDEVEPISLGEGDSPLVWDEVNGRRVAFKLDYLNPTGSYKDRGTTVLLSYLAWLGAESAVEDSSGNAGASFAAYSSRSGISGKVFVPSYASGPKRAQIEAYGGELIPVPGPRSKASEAVEKEANSGVIYASHVYQPYVLPGYATVVFEMLSQLGTVPGSVIAPAGQGSFLLGMARGFESLQNAGLVSKVPQIIGVQSRACAPLWAMANFGSNALNDIEEGDTVAEGIRIRRPLRGEEVVEVVRSSHGFMTAVEEKYILPGRDELARRGFYVEPTSAVVWPVLLEHIGKLNDPIVVVLTGSGLKYQPTS
jgi:threonine synthase